MSRPGSHGPTEPEIRPRHTATLTRAATVSYRSYLIACVPIAIFSLTNESGHRTPRAGFSKHSTTGPACFHGRRAEKAEALCNGSISFSPPRQNSACSRAKLSTMYHLMKGLYLYATSKEGMSFNPPPG